jgi:hypothetical protein
MNGLIYLACLNQTPLANDMLPKQGTLERVFLDKLLEIEQVSFLDLVGTGITEANIEQIAENLRNGMYASEEDDQIKFDA